MKEKKILKIFWSHYYFSVSRYHVTSNEVKNHIVRHNWVFKHICCINNPHWQSSGIITFLYKYYIVISDAMVGCFLFFVAGCNIIRASWETKKELRLSYRKNYIREFVWGTQLFWLHALLFMSLSVAFFRLSFCFFCCFLQVMYLLNGSCKDNIAMGSILCDDIMSERLKI